MKKFLLFIFINSIFPLVAFSNDYLDDHLQEFTWNGMRVVWLEDETLPTYDVVVYFDEGALSDGKRYGLTQMMFDLITTGTKSRFQTEIIDFLEYYGTSYGSNITHEYSSFSVSGLTKDLIPTMKLVCELMTDTVYPKKELDLNKKRIIHGLKNMVTNHSALAGRIFREVSLGHTPFSHPVNGTIKTISKIQSDELVKHREYFNGVVNKTIYLRGSKKVKELEKVLKNDCGWKQSQVAKKNDKEEIKFSKNEYENKIVFISVPDANQAQVRIGRALTAKEIRSKDPLRSFASHYMGSGFTSMLMQRLRVEKGLTYSVGSYASEQRDYGRAGISTFTKNQTIVDLLKNINEVVQENTKGISEETLKIFKKNIKGNYLFSLESSSGFLQKFITLDLRGKSYDEIYNFSPAIEKVTAKELEMMIEHLFNPSKQVTAIIGNKSLIPVLKKAGYSVVVKKYQDFL